MTSTTGIGPAAAWQVVAQMETSQVGPNNQYTQGVMITFKTASGNTGTVFLPQAQYSVDNVRAAVAARAALIDAVGGLTSQA